MRVFFVIMLVASALFSQAQCITTQPVNASTCQGTNEQATFSLVAPSATAFEWQLLNTSTSAWSSLSNGVNYSGVTNDSLIVTGLNTNPASISYRCIVYVGLLVCDTSQTVVLTVKSKPVLTVSGNNSVCSGVTGNVNLTLANSLGSSGATWTWNRDLLSGITPNTSSGTSSAIGETLTNSTSSSIQVSYTATTTTANCVSAPVTYIVTIKPKPVLTVTGNNSVCSGVTGNVNLTLTNSLGSGGATWTWNRDAMAGITPNTSSGVSSAIGETLTNSTSSSIQVSYTATTTTLSCVSAPVTYIVTIKPKPVLTVSGNNSVCSGVTGNVNLTLTNSLGSGGATWTWNRDLLSGITPNTSSGVSSAIGETLTNSTSSSIQVSYIATTTTAGCVSAPVTYIVTIKPKPILTVTGNNSVCSGVTGNVNLTLTNSLGSGGATWTWSRDVMLGITPNTNSGTSSSIGETLTNSTSSSIQVSYMATTTTAGCISSPQTFILTIKPKPNIQSASLSICSSNPIVFSPVNDADNIVPTSTLYSWSVPTSSSLSGMTAGNAQSAFGQTLTNTSGSDQNITYTLTPNSAGCIGSSFAVTANIKFEPTPQISGSQSICSGEAVQLFVNGGATYAWTPNMNINATFIENPTVSPTSTTTYSVLVTGSNGCSTSRSVAVNINTNPTITNIPSSVQSVCSGGTYSFTPITSSGASYEWTRENNGAYSSNVTNGSSAITNTLVNELQGPTTVAYNFNLINTTTGCVNAQTLNVTVYPLPSIANAADFVSSVCSNEPFNYSLEGSSSVNYSWARTLGSSVSSLNPNSGTSAIVNHSFVNNSNSQKWVEYSFALTTTTGGCQATETLGMWVQPNISLGSSTGTICSGNAVEYFPSVANNLNDVTVYWTRNSLPSGLTSTGASQGQGVISQTLINTTNAPLSVNYILLGYYNGCSSSAPNATYVVTVNPRPVVSISNTNNGVCSNSAWSTNLSSNITTGSNVYSWTSIAENSLNLSTGNSSGSGSFINHTWVNSTSDILNVQYSAQVTNNGCVSEPLIWNVSVKPLPVLINTPQNAAVCSGEYFSFVPVWNIPTATYIWTRTSPGSASGSTPINEVLSNVSNNPVNANYTILGSANACSSGNSSFIVSINPLPATASYAPLVFCNDEVATIHLSNWTGYDVEWSPANLFTNYQSALTVFVGSQSSTVIATAQNTYGCSLQEVIDITIGEPLEASFSLDGGPCQGSTISVAAINPNYDSYTWNINGNEVNSGSTSFALGVSDTVALTVQDENGCTSTTSQLLAGIANPQNEIFGSDILCQNQSYVTFNALAIDGDIHWSANNASLLGGQGFTEAVFEFGQGSQAIVYLESTNVTGCSTLDSLVISLSGQADSSYSIYMLGISTLVHPDSTFETYHWGKTNIATGIEDSEWSSYQYFNFGTLDLTQYYYWVETTNGEGCITRSYFNSPNIPNGIEEQKTSQIYVYPNPTSEGFIKFSVGRVESVQVFNQMGSFVLGATNTDALSISELGSGVYFVLLKVNGVYSSLKVVKL